MKDVKFVWCILMALLHCQNHPKKGHVPVVCLSASNSFMKIDFWIYGNIPYFPDNKSRFFYIMISGSNLYFKAAYMPTERKLPTCEKKTQTITNRKSVSQHKYHTQKAPPN